MYCLQTTDDNDPYSPCHPGMATSPSAVVSRPSSPERTHHLQSGHRPLTSILSSVTRTASKQEELENRLRLSVVSRSSSKPRKSQSQHRSNRSKSVAPHARSRPLVSSIPRPREEKHRHRPRYASRLSPDRRPMKRSKSHHDEPRRRSPSRARRGNEDINRSTRTPSLFTRHTSYSASSMRPQSSASFKNTDRSRFRKQPPYNDIARRRVSQNETIQMNALRRRANALAQEENNILSAVSEKSGSSLQSDFGSANMSHDKVHVFLESVLSAFIINVTKMPSKDKHLVAFKGGQPVSFNPNHIRHAFVNKQSYSVSEKTNGERMQFIIGSAAIYISRRHLLYQLQTSMFDAIRGTSNKMPACVLDTELQLLDNGLALCTVFDTAVWDGRTISSNTFNSRQQLLQDQFSSSVWRNVPAPLNVIHFQLKKWMVMSDVCSVLESIALKTSPDKPDGVIFVRNDSRFYPGKEGQLMKYKFRETVDAEVSISDLFTLIHQSQPNASPYLKLHFNAVRHTKLVLQTLLGTGSAYPPAPDDLWVKILQENGDRQSVIVELVYDTGTDVFSPIMVRPDKRHPNFSVVVTDFLRRQASFMSCPKLVQLCTSGVSSSFDQPHQSISDTQSPLDHILSSPCSTTSESVEVGVVVTSSKLATRKSIVIAPAISSDFRPPMSTFKFKWTKADQDALYRKSSVVVSCPFASYPLHTFDPMQSVEDMRISESLLFAKQLQKPGFIVTDPKQMTALIALSKTMDVGIQFE
jgi:hypothetical protein